VPNAEDRTRNHANIYKRPANASYRTQPSMIPITKPKLLDLCCGSGGCSTGYDRAGFDVTGVDIIERANYPYQFIKADALEIDLSGYDAIHASPPCQRYCWATQRHRNVGKVYPDILAPIRERLIDCGMPYVIENVPNAPLLNPTYLEGTMFKLNVIRRRGFETNWWLPQPMYIKRKKPIMQQSKKDPRIFIKKSAYCSVAGNGADGRSCRLADWQAAMDIDWMTRGEITQAIPPAYTEYLGRYLMGML